MSLRPTLNLHQTFNLKVDKGIIEEVELEMDPYRPAPFAALKQIQGLAFRRSEIHDKLTRWNNAQINLDRIPTEVIDWVAHQVLDS